jgi:hypothetical protein
MVVAVVSAAVAAAVAILLKRRAGKNLRQTPPLNPLPEFREGTLKTAPDTSIFLTPTPAKLEESPRSRTTTWLLPALMYGLLLFAALNFIAAAGLDPIDGGKIMQPDLLAYGALATVLAGLLFGFMRDRFEPLPTPPALHQPSLPFRPIPFIVGMALLLSVAEISGQVFAESYPVSQHLQFMMFSGGLILLAIGAGARLRIDLNHLDEMFPILGVTALALILRLMGVTSLFHFPMDEAHMMNAVVDLREHAAVPLMQPFALGSTFSWMYPYLQRLSVEIWGQTFLAIRMVSVIIGTLMIPALYMLGRELFSRRVGLVAALTLATFPPHLHFSRLGLLNIGETLFAVLAFAWLARGLRAQNRADYALAGLMLGLTQYFYEGGRLLYPALMLAWVMVLLLSPKRINRRGLMWLALTASSAALPFYYTWLNHDVGLTPKLTTYLGAWRNDPFNFLLHHLTPVVSHFVSRPDGAPFYYGGATPLLLGFTLPLFLLAVIFLLWRGRWQPGSMLLLLWLAGSIAGGSLLRDNTWTARYVVVFPALALFITVGIMYALRIQRTIIIAALTIMLAAGQTIYYFGAHLPTLNEQARSHMRYDFFDVLYRTAHLPRGTEVYLITDDPVNGHDLGQIGRYHPTALPVNVISLLTASPVFLTDLDPATDYALFVAPDNANTRMLIEGILNPPAPTGSPYHVPPDRQYIMYYIAGNGG